MPRRRYQSRQQESAIRLLKGPLEDTLPPLVRKLGLAKSALALGVGTSTIENWLQKMGCRSVWVLLGPGEEAGRVKEKKV